MEYSELESPLKLREYGRNVQVMVEYLVSVSDKEKRNRLAKEVYRIMASTTDSTNIQDLEQKVWDDMQHISGYKLNVDTPVELPTKLEVVQSDTNLPEFRRYKSKLKQYGRNIQLMVQKAAEMPDSEKRDFYILMVANIMKQMNQQYIGGIVTDNLIFEHIMTLSGGKIDLNNSGIKLEQKFYSKNQNRISNDYSRVSKRSGGGKNKNQGQSNTKKNSQSKKKRW